MGPLGADPANRRQNFRIALASNEFYGGGRFLPAACRTVARARARVFRRFLRSPEQMLTQFRRRIGRYSVFRKCWLEYAMSEKLGAHTGRHLSSFRGGGSSWDLAGPGPKTRDIRSRRFARARAYIHERRSAPGLHFYGRMKFTPRHGWI